ncbi:radical SAM protein [Helicobacter labetoulli]|uniref:radical SAM protein n=1 Tax=Helicobacter labetoulli TaxID=2315333 RepID=UPI00130016E6|nr:4Fe-4S cluster-binding domain-containing protein [Helicobacter labetoulli]
MFYRFIKRFGGTYFRLRVLFGMVDIPQLTIILTTKCTLKCESCSNLMQYFLPNEHFDTSFMRLQNDMEALLSAVSSIGFVHVIGGEPLLFKELPQVMSYLAKQPQIKGVELITNGTKSFSDELLDSLCYDKTRVIISDYSTNPALIKRLKHDEILHLLKERNIKYLFYHSNSLWRDVGKIFKRNRPKELIVKNYHACKMPCISLIGGNNNTLGGIFVCPIAAGLSKLRNKEEFDGDFVSLHSKTLRKDIISFYRQDFYKACDYCPNLWEGVGEIPVALQTTRTLRLE